MLATAQALGLTPRQRREAMDRMQAASDEIERPHQPTDPVQGDAKLLQNSAHEPNEQEQER